MIGPGENPFLTFSVVFSFFFWRLLASGGSGGSNADETVQHDPKVARNGLKIVLGGFQMVCVNEGQNRPPACPMQQE